VADVFDALTSSRAYHASRPIAEVLPMLKDSAGYDFDPTVVVAMIAWIESVARDNDLTADRLTIEHLLATCEPMMIDAVPLVPPAPDAEILVGSAAGGT
jgi:hypothetical protein